MATSKSEKNSPEYAVPALDKGLDILEMLAANPEPQSLSDLARLLNRSPGELYRLLQRLEKRTYIRRDAASGKYSLTLRLFELAHTHSPLEALLRAAAWPMKQLANEVGESVHLSVINQGAVLVLMDVAGPHRVRFSHEVGSRFSVVRTNSGRLLLAHLPQTELDLHLDADPDYAAMTPSRKEAFRLELERIRSDHLAQCPSEEIAGMHDIAVPIGNPAIGHVAALAIAYLSRNKTKSDVKRLTSALRQCASQITASQGLTT